MTEIELADVLRRLTRGKYKLNEPEMRAFLERLKSTTTDELLQATFPVKPARKPTAKKPNPQWIQDMETARKSLSWRVADAIARLYLLAEERSVEIKGAKKKSFVAASRHVAEAYGEESTRDLFLQWVGEFADANRKL